MIINMQLSHCLSLASLSLKLNWRPREENTFADGITNGDFSPFDASRLIPLKFSDIPQDIIWLLWETKTEFDSMKTEAKFMQGEVSRRRKRKRHEDKTPWWVGCVCASKDGVGVLDTSHLDGWFSSVHLDIDSTSIALRCDAGAHQTVDITKTITEKGAFSICICRRSVDVLVIHLWCIGGTFILFIYLWLECFAPARLTRVIAQASLGSPAGLCGFACWVGGWENLPWNFTGLRKFSFLGAWRFVLQFWWCNLQLDVVVNFQYFRLLKISILFQMDAFRHFSWKIFIARLMSVFSSDIITGSSRYIWYSEIWRFLPLSCQFDVNFGDHWYRILYFEWC